MDDKDGKKVHRIFTPEQKFEILKDIETFRTVKEGLEKYQPLIESVRGHQNLLISKDLRRRTGS